MQYFDLHCDTLFKAVTEGSNLDNPLFEVSVSQGNKFSKWSQCFAIWIPDDISDEGALSLFYKAHKKLSAESEKHDISILENISDFAKKNFIFTVENAKLLAGNIDRIRDLAEHNVKMITLTWNAENCIGGGSMAQHLGLTEFGRNCVCELEKANVVIDISHASDKTVYDVLSLTHNPLAASHSNSRTICHHMRNLPDEFIREIIKRGGVIGLNFHKEFLSDISKSASTKELLKHAEYMLSLGGEDSLCIGSDFDGSDIPEELNNIAKIPDLYESFLKIGYNEQLVQKIMYYNAYNFFSRF